MPGGVLRIACVDRAVAQHTGRPTCRSIPSHTDRHHRFRGAAFPDALIVVVGHAPDEIAHDALLVNQISTTSPDAFPGGCAPGFSTEAEGMTVVLSVVAAALLFPILIFIGGATRLAAARSECSPAAADSSASSAAKRWVIGVDSEQYDTVVENPGKADAFAWRRRILTSVVMRTAVGVHDIVTQFAQGEALPGVEVFDAANHGTDITDTGGFIGDLRPTIETWRQRIARHEITVPCVPANRTAQADSRHLASDYCTK